MPLFVPSDIARKVVDIDIPQKYLLKIAGIDEYIDFKDDHNYITQYEYINSCLLEGVYVLVVSCKTHLYNYDREGFLKVHSGEP